MYGYSVPTPERGIEVSLRSLLPQMVRCPFCDEWATATPPEGGEGLWYISKGCGHCRGIFAGGRWDVGSIVFQGPMRKITVCLCGVKMQSGAFTKHKKTASVPSDHCIVEETWVDKL